MENLKGKTAFITGGASGMGLGIARACAREGMNVVIVDFRQSAIDEAVAMFKRLKLISARFMFWSTMQVSRILSPGLLKASTTGKRSIWSSM